MNNKTPNTPVPLLEARNISKEFSGVYALRDVNLEIYPSMVNAVIGENGAGKSTLMKIISGVYTGHTGRILMEGKEVSFRSPREAEEHGISIIHQELNLIPGMTVAENIFLGKEPLNTFGLINYREMNEKAKVLMDRLHLFVSPKTSVDTLKVGQQQLVEIARVLNLKSRVLIMDEPTSAISDKESELLFQIIRDLKSKGVSILYISHRLDELLGIADQFVALRDGKNAGGGKIATTTRNEMIKMMVGREILPTNPIGQAKNETELLKVKNLSLRDPNHSHKFRVKGADLILHKGEILGISGLMGAGRTELLEAIFGLHKGHTTGELFIEGKQITINSPGEAISKGLVMVPEDRKTLGLVQNMDVLKNTTLASLKNFSRGGFINHAKEKQTCKYYVSQLNIKLSSLSQPVETLSGGNQQKLVIAKWLATQPRIILLDEPTRGIDIGAKQEIYQLIEQLASKGMAIIMVSSELPEILALSHKIIVMCESQVTAYIDRADASEEIIMKAAVPVGKSADKEPGDNRQ